MVTFTDEAAPEADQWARLGARVGLPVAEVAVFPPRLRLLGDVALLALRARTEAAARERVVVVYTRRKPFRRALGIAGGAGATALLVAPDGRVLWRGAGTIEMGAVAGLEAAVAAIR